MTNRYTRDFGPLCFAILALSSGPLPDAAAAAQIKGYARNCPETKELCVWHKAVVTPPKGWIEDETWTQRYRRIAFFENGEQSFSQARHVPARPQGR